MSIFRFLVLFGSKVKINKKWSAFGDSSNVCTHECINFHPTNSLFSAIYTDLTEQHAKLVSTVYEEKPLYARLREPKDDFLGAVYIQSNMKAIWLHFYQQYLQTAVWAVKPSSICGPNQPVVKHWPSTPHPYGLDALLSSFSPMHTVQLVPSPWPGSNPRLSYAALDCGFLSKTALADHCQGINSLLFLVMISAGFWIPSVILNRSHR